MIQQSDEVDNRILRLLTDNARAGVREIADKLQISPSTVSRRIKRMEDSGIIRGYVALTNESRMGLDACMVLLMKTKGGVDTQGLIDRICNRDEACTCLSVAGNYDIVLIAYCKKPTDVRGFIEELKAMGEFEHIDSNLITSQHKVMLKKLTTA